MTPAARFGESGTPQGRRWPLRLLRAVRRINADQQELWERWVRAQRPWEREWLRWERDPGGEWRLEGSFAPPAPRRRGPSA